MEKLQEKITYFLNCAIMHQTNLKQGYKHFEMKFMCQGQHQQNGIV
jgi:hypothetical protein